MLVPLLYIDSCQEAVCVSVIVSLSDQPYYSGRVWQQWAGMTSVGLEVVKLLWVDELFTGGVL